MRRLQVCLAALLLGLVSAVASAQPINVKSYGAVGNGIADDTVAFNNALAAAPATGAEIYIPAGTYKLTNTLSVVNKSIAFRGEGQRVSILRWDAFGGNGLNFQSTTTNNVTLTVKSLSFLKAGATGGTAINASWLATASWHGDNGLVTTSIEDLHVAASPHASGVGWAGGIALANATNAKLRNFTIMGVAHGAGGSGIIFTGKSISNYVSDGDISHFYYGISTWDSGEGFHFSDVEIIAVEVGIKLVADVARPGTSVQGCHINSSTEGISTWGFGDLAITNNLIYRWGTGAWMGIHIIHGDSNRISGNYVVVLSAGGTPNGIVLEGNTVRNIVSNNITEGMGSGIWLVSPSVADNIVMGNLNRFFTVAGITNGGVNHLFSNP